MLLWQAGSDRLLLLEEMNSMFAKPTQHSVISSACIQFASGADFAACKCSYADPPD